MLWLPLLKSPLKQLCYQTQMKKTHPFPSLLMLVSGKLLGSDARIADLNFEKHVYGHVRKIPLMILTPGHHNFVGNSIVVYLTFLRKLREKDWGFLCFLTVPLRYGLVLLQLNQP